MTVYCPGPSVFCTTGPTPVAAVVLSGSSLTIHAYETMRLLGPAVLGLPSMTTLAVPAGPVAIMALGRGSLITAWRRVLLSGAGGACAIVGGGGQ